MRASPRTRPSPRTVTGPRYEELYAKFAEQAPGFGEYRNKTSRVIPIVQLQPKE